MFESFIIERSSACSTVRILNLYRLMFNNRVLDLLKVLLLLTVLCSSQYFEYYDDYMQPTTGVPTFIVDSQNRPIYLIPDQARSGHGWLNSIWKYTNRTILQQLYNTTDIWVWGGVFSTDYTWLITHESTDTQSFLVARKENGSLYSVVSNVSLEI